MKGSLSIPIIGITLLGILVCQNCNSGHNLEEYPITSKENYSFTKQDSLEHVKWIRENSAFRRLNSTLGDYKGQYHYNVTISDTHYLYHRRGDHHRKDAKLINGTYIWDMNTYLPDEQAMFDYILDHLPEMQRFKKTSKELSYSQDLEYFDEHYSDYWDDPEEGITYPDDVFDYLLD